MFLLTYRIGREVEDYLRDNATAGLQEVKFSPLTNDTNDLRLAAFLPQNLACTYFY